MAARVIGELARVSGVEYEPDADGNVSKVVSLLRSGRTEADLVAVVRDRARRWRGDEKMAEYLRPATVFGKQKFPDYLAQARTTGGGAGEAELAAVREREAGFDTPDFGDWGAR